MTFESGDLVMHDGVAYAFRRYIDKEGKYAIVSPSDSVSFDDTKFAYVSSLTGVTNKAMIKSLDKEY